MIVKTLILFQGMLKGSKVPMAELVGKGKRIHEDSGRENDGTDERKDMEMEKSDAVCIQCKSMRLMFLSLPLRVIKGQDTSVTSVTPTVRQRLTDTDRGTEEEREKQTWEEEDGKDVDMPGHSKDAKRTENKR